MVLSPRRRRGASRVEDPAVAPIQFRLEAREERITTDDGRELTGRGYMICDPKTAAPLGEDDFFFRIGGGIVCDLAGADQHLDELQASAFRPGASLALVRRESLDELDSPQIEVRDAAGTVTVGELGPEVSDAVNFYGTESYGAAFCLWEWRTESGQRFALRLLLAPGWTVEQIAEEPAAPEL
jgi:hypothetical protein